MLYSLPEQYDMLHEMSVRFFRRGFLYDGPVIGFSRALQAHLNTKKEAYDSICSRLSLMPNHPMFAIASLCFKRQAKFQRLAV